MSEETKNTGYTVFDVKIQDDWKKVKTKSGKEVNIAPNGIAKEPFSYYDHDGSEIKCWEIRVPDYTEIKGVMLSFTDRANATFSVPARCVREIKLMDVVIIKDINDEDNYIQSHKRIIGSNNLKVDFYDTFINSYGEYEHKKLLTATLNDYKQAISHDKRELVKIRLQKEAQQRNEYHKTPSVAERAIAAAKAPKKNTR